MKSGFFVLVLSVIFISSFLSVSVHADRTRNIIDDLNTGLTSTNAEALISDAENQIGVKIKVYIAGAGEHMTYKEFTDAGRELFYDTYNLDEEGLPAYNVLIYAVVVEGKQTVGYFHNGKCESFDYFLNNEIYDPEGASLDDGTIVEKIQRIIDFIKKAKSQYGPECAAKTVKGETDIIIGTFVYLIDDTDWKNVLSLIPLTTWHDVPNAMLSLSDEEKMKERKNHIKYKPTLVYHREGENLDLESINLFLQQFGKATKIIAVYGDTVPKKLSGVANDKLSVEDYKTEWKKWGYEYLVLSEDNYKTGLMASVFASYLHAPLIFSSSELKDYPDAKEIYCIGNVQNDKCKKNFTLGELQKYYSGITGTDKNMLVNPNDIYDKNCENFIYYRETGKLTKAYCKDSLVAPILASVKNELIIFTDAEPLSEGLRFTNPEYSEGFYVEQPDSNNYDDIYFYFFYKNNIEKVNFGKKTKEILEYGLQKYPTTSFEKKEYYRNLFENNKLKQTPSIKDIFLDEKTETVYVLYKNGAIELIKNIKTDPNTESFSSSIKLFNSRHTCYGIYNDLSMQGINEEKSSFEAELEDKHVSVILDMTKQTDMLLNNYLTIIASPRAIPNSGYSYCIVNSLKGEFVDFRYTFDIQYSQGKAVGRIFGITVSDTSSYINRVIVFSKNGYSYVTQKGETKSFTNIGLLAAYNPTYQGYINQLEEQLTDNDYETSCFVSNPGLAENGCEETQTFTDTMKKDLFQNNDIIIYDDHGDVFSWVYPGITKTDLEKYNISSAIVIAATCSGLDYYSSLGYDLLASNFIKNGGLGYYGSVSATLWSYISREVSTRILATNLGEDKILSVRTGLQGYDLGNALSSALRDADIKTTFDIKKVDPNYALLGDPTILLALPQKIDLAFQEQQKAQREYYCGVNGCERTAKCVYLNEAEGATTCKKEYCNECNSKSTNAEIKKCCDSGRIDKNMDCCFVDEGIDAVKAKKDAEKAKCITIQNAEWITGKTAANSYCVCKNEYDWCNGKYLTGCCVINNKCSKEKEGTPCPLNKGKGKVWTTVGYNCLCECPYGSEEDPFTEDCTKIQCPTGKKLGDSCDQGSDYKNVVYGICSGLEGKVCDCCECKKGCIRNNAYDASYRTGCKCN
ncbi:MAG: C25 family cysteine peptidase [Candidatus Aenigmatarchaeota archaeon]